jgi:hypothetical protein
LVIDAMSALVLELLLLAHEANIVLLEVLAIVIHWS